MPLTANPLPSIVPGFTVPFDAALALANAQTLVATGFLNNVNTQLDLAIGASASFGAGRVVAMAALDITAMDFASGDEAYKVSVLGSNDVAFGNGNVELLAFHDFAAAPAVRQIANLLGASPAVPPVGLAGTVIAIPFTNLMQRIVYRYIRMHVVISGTTPTTTMSAWISPIEMRL